VLLPGAPSSAYMHLHMQNQKNCLEKARIDTECVPQSLSRSSAPQCAGLYPGMSFHIESADLSRNGMVGC